MLVCLFYNYTATTQIYTLSLHDALPICVFHLPRLFSHLVTSRPPLSPSPPRVGRVREGDRKSTRLNSSHRCISYAVFCLKKKKIKYLITLYSESNKRNFEAENIDKYKNE